MTDLNYEEANNPGGNTLVRFVPVGGVTALPPVSSPVTQGPPTFRTGWRWFNLYGTLHTKTYDEEEGYNDNGPLWNVTISVFLPADSPLIRQTLAEMSPHRFVVEVTDSAGMLRRAGNLIEHLEMKYKFGTGAQMADRRGATITFTGVFTRPVPVVL